MPPVSGPTKPLFKRPTTEQDLPHVRRQRAWPWVQVQGDDSYRRTKNSIFNGTYGRIYGHRQGGEPTSVDKEMVLTGPSGKCQRVTMEMALREYDIDQHVGGPLAARRAMISHPPAWRKALGLSGERLVINYPLAETDLHAALVSLHWMPYNEHLLRPIGRFVAERCFARLHALHTEKKVLHRDINPDNMMVDREGEIWLRDFGFATTLPAPPTSQMLGTLWYIAPELHHGYMYGTERQPYSEASDVYAMTISVLEFIASPELTAWVLPRVELARHDHEGVQRLHHELDFWRLKTATNKVHQEPSLQDLHALHQRAVEILGPDCGPLLRDALSTRAHHRPTSEAFVKALKLTEAERKIGRGFLMSQHALGDKIRGAMHSAEKAEKDVVPTRPDDIVTTLDTVWWHKEL